ARRIVLSRRGDGRAARLALFRMSTYDALSTLERDISGHPASLNARRSAAGAARGTPRCLPSHRRWQRRRLGTATPPPAERETCCRVSATALSLQTGPRWGPVPRSARRRPWFPP